MPAHSATVRHAAAGIGLSTAALAAVGTPSSLLASAVLGAMSAAGAVLSLAVAYRRTRQPALLTMEDLGRLVLACAIGAVAVGATTGVAAALLSSDPPFRVGLWALSAQAAATLLVLPFLLTTSHEPSEAGRAERLAQTGLLLLLLVIAFAPGSQAPIGLAPGAALAWAGLRCGMRYVLVQAVLTNIAVAAVSLIGWGPFATYAARNGSPSLALALVHVFVVAVGLVVLALTVTVEERRIALAEVARMSFYDALTGVGNRRLLEDRLTIARGRAARGEPATLLVLDLDGFKAVNDADGHLRGDQVLVGVAERIHALIRPTDSLVRLGGDEFALLLPGMQCGSAAVTDLCRRIETAIAQPVAGVTQPVGVSIGSAPVIAGGSSDEVLNAADRAMYAAKTAGRRLMGEIPPPRRPVRDGLGLQQRAATPGV